MNTQSISVCLFAGVLAVSTATASAGDGQPNWQGFYAGAALGTTHSEADFDSKLISDAYFVPGDVDQINPLLGQELDSNDLSGAILFGYNVQQGRWVYGFESDFTLMNASESQQFGPTPYDTLPTEDFTFRHTLEAKYLFSLRAKVGYRWGKALIYASAGPALGKFEYDARFSDTNAGANNTRYTDSRTAFGFAGGVGISYALDNNWVIQGDYLYSHFSDAVEGKSYLESSPNDGIDYDSDFTSSSLRVALIKRF